MSADEPELLRLVNWIRQAEGGPGIPVGNPQSHPKDLALSRDGIHPARLEGFGPAEAATLQHRCAQGVGCEVYIFNGSNAPTVK